MYAAGLDGQRSESIEALGWSHRDCVIWAAARVDGSAEGKQLG